MRRPPGLWILLSAGVVWLSLQDVYGLRATSLIFGKTTTTTTTTEEPEALEEETVTTELNGDPDATKPNLTGNPQLDYIWDPNLPKELNGFNLSDYPFYERVPEDIDFKCDGLHDGFYASVKHKCQVYHHCLFGTRYDFLCGNYTAFDQKTFICHFASEVDCANSKKFWHRNDALYKSASTTTIKPIVIHTPPPPPAPITVSAIEPLGPSGPSLRRPIGSRRRPFRRRRPQFDYYEDEYYDDYYEERPRSNRGRKRPKPRPRPVYDDEYDGEYEDVSHEPRGGSRRDAIRRPYESRRPFKNRERVKYDYEETDDRLEDEDYFKLKRSRKPIKRKKTVHEESEEEEDYPDRRKQVKRRPSIDRSEENDKKPSRKTQRVPLDDYEDDIVQVDNSRYYEGRRRNEGQRNKPKEETRTIIKPVSGTIYDRPRVAPRIKRPVPKNEADKYAYKPIPTEAASAQEDEEYYEDYEEEPVLKIKTTPKIPRDPRPEHKEESKSSNSRKQMHSTTSRSHPRRPADSYETPKETPISEEYYDDYEEQEEEDKGLDEKVISKTEKSRKFLSSTSPSIRRTTTSTTTTTQRSTEKTEQPVIRLIKRPFLPSRGGSPYITRGLQPIGMKAVKKTPEIAHLEKEERHNQDEVIDDQTNREKVKMKYEDAGALKNNTDELQPAFKPSPIIVKMPLRVPAINTENFRSQHFAGPRTTQKPKSPERNPLDINEDDYDVALNDALNPALPVRGSPVGFSPSNDYSFISQRPRYESDLRMSAESSDYAYQIEPYRHAYVPRSSARDHLVNSNIKYSGQYSTLRENYRPVQHQTEAFYSRY